MTKPVEEKLSFEQAITELESLVEKMESGQMTLEASVQAYTRGAELAKLCKEQLEAAEAKLKILQPNGLLETATIDGVSRSDSEA